MHKNTDAMRPASSIQIVPQPSGTQAKPSNGIPLSIVTNHLSSSGTVSEVSLHVTRHTAGSVCNGLDSTLRSRQEAQDRFKTARRKLIIVAALCATFTIAEVVGGLYAHSLAVLTDAAHLLSDLAGLLISLFALWLSNKPPKAGLSFGFHRAEIIGALASVLLIWLVTGVLLYEAVDRVLHPQVVDGALMFLVSACGLLVNCVMGWVLHRTEGVQHSHSHGGGNEHGHSHSHGEEIQERHQEHEPENVNVRSVALHVLGDAIQSVGVMIAAALIWTHPDWTIADPICTFLFSILVLCTTVGLVKQSVQVLMEAAPDHLDENDVEAQLRKIEGVSEVHDLHIWSLTIGKTSLSAHLSVSPDAQNVLQTATKLLSSRYRIYHTTLQLESHADDVGCRGNGKTPLTNWSLVDEKKQSKATR